MLVPEPGLLRDVHLGGSERSGGIALTFDDGPNGICTSEVLDALRDLGAPATFFVLGANAAQPGADQLLARMVREGHTIALHGWEHGVRRLFWSDLTADDLARARTTIEAALGRQGLPAPPIRYFRPPFGFLIGPTVRGAHAAGLSVVEWTVSVEDWRPRSADALALLLLESVRPGDVVVLHDGNRDDQRSTERCVERPQLASALRRFIPALAERGLRVLPLGEVLGVDATPRVDSAAVAP